MLNGISGIYKKSKEQRISICYRGPFVDQLTSDLIQFSENAMEPGKSEINIQRRVTYLLMECFQNVIRHGASINVSSELGKNDGLFWFRNFDGFYIINSINRLENHEIDNIISIVDQLNGMNAKELHQMYRERLEHNTISDLGGAGLGLIELARKSGQKLKYRFEKLDDTHSLFHEQVSFAPQNQADNIPDFIDETSAAFNDMITHHRMLQYKGDFSQRTLLPILKIVETTCSDESTAGKARKVGHAVVEVMQNISRHGIKENQDGSSGVFIIGKKNDHIFIEAGNSITLSEKVILKEKLDYLTSLDMEGLKDLHRKAIKSSIRFENKQRSGLGLIEIARMSCDNLRYAFEDLGKDKLFFSLHVGL